MPAFAFRAPSGGSFRFGGVSVQPNKKSMCKRPSRAHARRGVFTDIRFYYDNYTKTPLSYFLLLTSYFLLLTSFCLALCFALCFALYFAFYLGFNFALYFAFGICKL